MILAAVAQFLWKFAKTHDSITLTLNISVWIYKIYITQSANLKIEGNEVTMKNNLN